MSRKVYGVSSKYDYGKWDHVVYVFESMEEAKKWVIPAEYDFYEREREREIMSKKAAIKLAGKKAVDMAIDYVAIQEQLKQMH